MRDDIDKEFHDWYYEKLDIVREAEKELTEGYINEAYLENHIETFRDLELIDKDIENIHDLLKFVYEKTSHLVCCKDRLQFAMESGDLTRILECLVWIKEEYNETYEEVCPLLDEKGIAKLREYSDSLDESFKLILTQMVEFVLEGELSLDAHNKIVGELMILYNSEACVEADWVLRMVMAEGTLNEFVQIYLEDMKMCGHTDFVNMHMDMITRLTEESEKKNNVILG